MLCNYYTSQHPRILKYVWTYPPVSSSYTISHSKTQDRMHPQHLNPVIGYVHMWCPALTTSLAAELKSLAALVSSRTHQ